MGLVKEKVLIADDNPVNLDIFQEILEDDYDIKMVTDGVQALDSIKNFMPKVILLDIMMPKIDGYEVCRQIRANKELQGVKIIMVSARAMESERLKGIEVGADEYITKPFDEDVLLEMVKSHLD